LVPHDGAVRVLVFRDRYVISTAYDIGMVGGFNGARCPWLQFPDFLAHGSVTILDSRGTFPSTTRLVLGLFTQSWDEEANAESEL